MMRVDPPPPSCAIKRSFSDDSCMMLKFSADQLSQLQHALAPPPIAPLNVPPCLSHVPSSKKEAPSGEFELHLPLLVIFTGYVVVSTGGWLCSLLHPLPKCASPLYPVLMVLLVLHAYTKKSTLCIVCTIVLVTALPYLSTSPPWAISAWCVGLAFLFVLHANKRSRLLACTALMACCCSCAFALTSPALPPFMRVTGVMCSLMVGGLASCLDRQGYVRVRIDTV